MRKLYDRNVAAEEEYKQARDRFRIAAAEVERQQAEVAVIKEQIDDTTIRAPLSGHLTEKLVDVGDFVDIGDPMATLYTTGAMEIAFWLPERFATEVTRGQRVTATSAAYPDEKFEGRLVFVSPIVDSRTREFQLKAHIRDPQNRLKPGVSASAEVILDTRDQNPVLPEECLVSMRSGYAVFVVEDGKARVHDVKIGLRAPGRVEISEGISPGDEVIRTGHMQLVDGDNVKVTSRDGADSATQPGAKAADTRPAEEAGRP